MHAARCGQGMMTQSVRSRLVRREEEESTSSTMAQPPYMLGRATFGGGLETHGAAGGVDRRGIILVGIKSLIPSTNTTSKPCYSACCRPIFESSTGKGQNSLMPKSTPCRRTKTPNRLNDHIYSDT